MSSGSVFFYTFRTNKFVGEIEGALGQKVYVIDKPAQDFEKLLYAIEQSGAELICGIGMSKRYTRFEEKTFNRVGKSKIDKDSPDEFELGLPKESAINTDSKMTFGPCNYVAFRLKVKFPDKKHYFLHLVAEDIGKLQAVAF